MIVDGRVGMEVGLSDMKVSLISLFELQAKTSKLGVRPEYVVEAVNAVLKAFTYCDFLILLVIFGRSRWFVTLPVDP
jgi:hypothetical protein